MGSRQHCLAAVAAVVALAAPAAANDFPDGPGKEIFVKACGSCHDINRSRAGYSPYGWRQVMRMMRHFDLPVAEEEWPQLTAYLIKSFPERPRPTAVIIPGPIKVSFKQWPVPTLGSRPHDPLATRDGMIWWTGQTSNVMGRLNPKTGDFKEFPLKTMHSGPHGAAEDKHGNIWFTGNHVGIIGKLDPKSGRVTEYKMPDPEVRDPHTLNFAPDGMLWFTAQQGNVIGRLDPASGEIKLIRSPTPRSRPYGLLVNGKGVPVVVLFGTNKVATVDPAALTIKEYPLPDPAARPRRLALEGDSIVWYTDYPRGTLGRLDLATGAVKEWASPSGPQSQPYGIVFTKGALWYNEAGAKPNTIVRFDPKTEKFQSWPIPGDGDIVRNMDVMPDGNPVTANSLVNQVGLIEVHDSSKH
jgi:virginiamycin B lyase